MDYIEKFFKKIKKFTLEEKELIVAQGVYE